MSVSRYYSSTAASTTLTGGIGSGATSIVVASVSGFPVSYPYTLIIDRTGTKEAIKVTGAAGTTLTVVRGQDGTSAVAHNNGDAIEHGATAQDFREPQEHIAATTDIHGLAGGAAVVGTTSSQTLTNKTLTTPTIGSFTNSTHTHANNAGGGTVAHSALTGLTTGDPHTQYQQESEKAAASGYASLDGTTKVPIAQLPTGTTSSTVALGSGIGALVARTIQAGFTVAGGTTSVTTDDFATTADTAYEMKVTAGYFTPAAASGFNLLVGLQYSTDSGGAWTNLSTIDGSVIESFRYDNSGSAGDQGMGPAVTIFVPGAHATFRVRARFSRSAGVTTADLPNAIVTVVRIGTDET